LPAESAPDVLTNVSPNMPAPLSNEGDRRKVDTDAGPPFKHAELSPEMYEQLQSMSGLPIIPAPFRATAVPTSPDVSDVPVRRMALPGDAVRPPEATTEAVGIPRRASAATPQLEERIQPSPMPILSQEFARQDEDLPAPQQLDKVEELEKVKPAYSVEDVAREHQREEQQAHDLQQRDAAFKHEQEQRLEAQALPIRENLANDARMLGLGPTFMPRLGDTQPQRRSEDVEQLMTIAGLSEDQKAQIRAMKDLDDEHLTKILIHKLTGEQHA
jgi:hypothetical protein